MMNKRFAVRIRTVAITLLMLLVLSSCTLTVKKPGGNGGGTNNGTSDNGGSGNNGGSTDGGNTDGGNTEGGGDGGGNTDGGNIEGGDVVFPEDGTTDSSDGWENGLTFGITSVRAFLGHPLDLTELVPDGFGEELTWTSNCDNIATVEDGVVTAVKCGRTKVVCENAEGKALSFRVTVEFMVSSNSGYNVITDVVDEKTYFVQSNYGANRVLDEAIANHVKKLTIDFSGIRSGFSIDDFDLEVELGGHVSFKTSYYEDKPSIVTFEIVYNAATASTKTEQSVINKSESIANGNSIARRVLDGADRRPDDFEGFAINSKTETFDVYNTEELWWAIEHGYRPVFPIQNTKVELFYERAKTILREIVTDTMTDYEKTAAIYEYLIENVSYDYDSFEKNSSKDNMCYYLEGVFENGLAVCDGKTKALVVFLGIEGIECLRDYGASRSGGAGHAWNYVKIDGEWYLVDTTEGDSRYSIYSGSPIAEFYGKSVEGVSYNAFLSPASAHYAKYVYGEIWAEIFDNPDGIYPDISDRYFSVEIAEGVDFVLDSADEARAIIEAVTAVVDDGEFILTLMLEGDEQNIHKYLKVTEDYNLKTAIFTTKYGEETVYIVLFDTAMQTEAD